MIGRFSNRIDFKPFKSKVAISELLRKMVCIGGLFMHARTPSFKITTTWFVVRVRKPRIPQEKVKLFLNLKPSNLDTSVLASQIKLNFIMGSKSMFWSVKFQLDCELLIWCKTMSDTWSSNDFCIIVFQITQLTVLTVLNFLNYNFRSKRISKLHRFSPNSPLLRI